MVMLRGAPLPQAEQIIFITLGFYEASAFFIGAVWGCAAVSDDLRLGAFQFYFARALRVRTYVAGKLLGLAALAGLPMLAGPLILGLLRLLYADGLDDAVQASPIVLRAAALGLIGTAAYVLPVAGLGALAGRRQLAQALYAVYWLLICPALWSMSWPLHLPALRLFSVPANLTCIGRELFGVAHDRSDPPTWAAALALSVLCAAGLWLVWRSVDRAAHRGLGGGA
jgi:ABC-type Na+ efflux pump permease subunit